MEEVYLHRRNSAVYGTNIPLNPADLKEKVQRFNVYEALEDYDMPDNKSQPWSEIFFAVKHVIC